jgi:hypothetical protein
MAKLEYSLRLPKSKLGPRRDAPGEPYECDWCGGVSTDDEDGHSSTDLRRH